MKFSHKTIIILLLLFSCQMTFADYSGEASIGYITLEDSPSNDKATSFGVSVILNFEPVSTQEGPLAEAFFLNPSSNINFLIDEWKYEYESFPDTDKQKRTLFGGTLVDVSRFFEVGVNLGNTKYTESSSVFSVESDDLVLDFIFHIKKGQVFGYTRDTMSFDDTVNLDKIKSDYVFYRQLFTLTSQQYLAIEIGHEKRTANDSSSSDTVKFNTVDVSYYLNRNTGVMFAVSKIDDDDDGANGTLMLFGLESFISPTVKVGLAYINYSGGSDSDEDTKGFGLTASARF